MLKISIYDIIENSDIIYIEATNTLKALDTSTSPLALVELNKLLIALYNRLEYDEIIVEEISSKVPITQVRFIHWVKDNFARSKIDAFVNIVGGYNETKV